MKTDKKLISIIVPNKTPSQNLEKLLPTIAKQKVKFNFEVIIVSNPKPAKLKVSAINKLELKWFHSPIKGANVARNLGVKYAKGDWLFFIDDDCLLPHENFLQNLEVHLKNASQKAILGGGYIRNCGKTFESTSESNRYSAAYHIIQMNWIKNGLSKKYGWQNFVGGNLILHKSTFLDHQFDESIVFGATEHEFVSRLLRSGYHGLQIEDSELIHNHNLNKTNLIMKGVYQGIGYSLIKHRNLNLEPDFTSKLYSASLNDFQREISIYNLGFHLGEIFFQKGIFRPTQFQVLKARLLYSFSQKFNFTDLKTLRLEKFIERL